MVLFKAPEVRYTNITLGDQAIPATINKKYKRTQPRLITPSFLKTFSTLEDTVEPFQSFINDSARVQIVEGPRFGQFFQEYAKE